MALSNSGLMNPSNYEQGFVNPYPNSTGSQDIGSQRSDIYSQVADGSWGSYPYPNLSGPLGAAGNSQGQPDIFQGTYVNPAQYYTPNYNYSGPSTIQNGILNVGSGSQLTESGNQLANQNASGTDGVAGLYQSLLGRAPDAAGLQYWNQQLASGKSINDIANAFKQTPEYLQRQQQPQVRPNPSTQPNTNPYGITTANPFASSNNPYIQASQQTALGNLAGAQTATAANRVNQQTPYGSLQYTQTGTDAQGNPIWSANQTLSPQLQALTQQSLSGLQSSLSNPAYGINPGQTYSDAIMQRLQPQQQQAQSRLETQLANQGIMPGSEAYNRARTQLSQQQNDQLTSAIVGGMQTGLQANTAQNQTAANIKSLASPGYVNPYSQAATSGPDYTGAFATSQAADIAAQNAALDRQNSMTSGLFKIGTAGILGSGGLTGLASAIPGAYNWLTGTAASDYWTNPSSAGTFAGDIFKL